MRSITRACGIIVAYALTERPAVPLAHASRETAMTIAAPAIDSLSLEIDRAYIRNDSTAITSLLQRAERNGRPPGRSSGLDALCICDLSKCRDHQFPRSRG